MQKTKGISLKLFNYIITFMLSMIGFELILEKANGEFHDVDSFAAVSTLFQFGMCSIFPLMLSFGAVLKTFPRSRQELMKYIQLSMIVFGATFQATRSIKYVRYPTKVVFKSAKLIPTMIVSTIIHKGATKYSFMDYFAAVLLCLGTAGYSYGSKSTSSSKVKSDSYIGIMLLIGSITFDAIVPNLQQRLMTTSKSDTILPHTKNDTDINLTDKNSNGNSANTDTKSIETSSQSSTTITSSGISAHGLMFNVNTIGFMCIFIYMLFSGTIAAFIPICIEHPRLLMYCIMLGLCLAIAVLAYTKLIKASGSVLAVTVATMRKVITVVLSYVIFPKPLLRMHVLSGLLVLTGVFVNGEYLFCNLLCRN